MRLNLGYKCNYAEVIRTYQITFLDHCKNGVDSRGADGGRAHRQRQALLRVQRVSGHRVQPRGDAVRPSLLVGSSLGAFSCVFPALTHSVVSSAVQLAVSVPGAAAVEAGAERLVAIGLIYCNSMCSGCKTTPSALCARPASARRTSSRSTLEARKPWTRGEQ
jgi:hypothetical protein